MLLNPKDFKIRCSAISKIMAGSIGLTDKQKERIAELVGERDTGANKNGNAVSWTAKKKEELAKLEDKRDNPDLPKGAKTYCDNWIKERLYNKRNRFTSKYTTKGDWVEDDAIYFLIQQEDIFAIKNEKYFENDWMIGTPDIVQPNEIIDIKSSYSHDTFPLFEEKLDNDYWWQVQGYMELVGKANGRVVYCLMNTPDFLIEREAKKLAYGEGRPEKETEYYEKLKKEMTYDNVPAYLRMKSYPVPREETAIAAIKNRVELCRKYIEKRLKQITLPHRQAA